MARTWTEVRAAAVAKGGIDEQRVENAKRDLQEAVRAHRLADVRKSQSMNQTEVAALMAVSQARVSKLESGDVSRTEVGTLVSYVNALGGTLRVVADFGDTKLTVI